MLNEIFIAALVGALLDLDTIAFGRFMMSRPVVAGPIIGLLCGDVAAGILVGVLIELLWIDMLPIGVGVPPDSTIVAAIAIFLSVSKPIPALGAAIILAVPFGIVFKYIDSFNRRWNKNLCSYLENKIREEKYNAINLVVWFGILTAFIRAFMFLFISMYLLKQVSDPIFDYILMHTGLTGAMMMFVTALPVLGLVSIIVNFERKLHEKN